VGSEMCIRDRLTDLAVTTASEDGNAWRRAICLLHMNADGTVKRFQPIDLGETTESPPDTHDWFGSSIASVGDLDANGVIDLAVGAPGANAGGYRRGAAYLLLLEADGSVKRREKIVGSASGPQLADEDGFGSCLATLGDLDGDGAADLAIGASGDSTGGEDRGAMHLVFLRPFAEEDLLREDE